MGKHFNTRIREARERARLSQAELGEKFGVTGPTISNWENRVSQPWDDLYFKVLAWVERVEGRPGRADGAAVRRSAPTNGKLPGEDVRRARIKNAWSQSELGEKLGVTQATVSNWETSKGHPDASQTLRLQQILGLQAGADDDEAEDDEVDRDSTGPAAFGTWLNRTRLERRLSVAELAAKAGVSTPAVYNIESGRIGNPRAETVRRLEEALGKDLPAETRKEIKDEATVEGVGEFVEFDPNDRNDWPDVPGIYVLYDISERPIYVGQGANIRRRIQDHEQKFWFKTPIVETAACIKIEDASLREKIETILIRFLKRHAVINKQNVER